MFRRKTIFILGAGSSYWCGYPLGNQLIDKIITDMEDEIYVPVPKRYYGKRNASENPYPLEWVFEETCFLKETDIFLKNSDKYPENGGRVSNANNYYRKIKILDISGFKDLKTALCYQNPSSIDSFLQHNETSKDIAKKMIVYSLLKREDKRIFERQENKNDNWYANLFHDLTASCDENSVFSNKINILTFNYDTSLEYYIHSRLLASEKFKNLDGDLFENKLTHIYGDISHGKDKKEYGEFFESRLNGTSPWRGLISDERGISADTKGKLNTIRFACSAKSFNHIKTMDEERNGKARTQLINENRDLLIDAEDIVIIGFGFDSDNLIQLGFLPGEIALGSFLTANGNFKTIKWHNYKGEKTRVSSMFSKIKEASHNFEIIESTTEDISSAYINAFK